MTSPTKINSGAAREATQYLVLRAGDVDVEREQLNKILSKLDSRVSVVEESIDSLETNSRAGGIDFEYNTNQFYEVGDIFNIATGGIGFNEIDFTSFDTDSLTEGATNLFFTDERAQDSVGVMCTDGTLVYVDGTPLLTRGAISGDITIAQGSSTSAITSGVIVNDDVNASAAIALSKLAALTASRALVSDVSGVISVSSVTDTELGYVSGVTSAIQTQLNNKQPLDATLTAFAALTIAADSLTVGTGADAFNQTTFAANTFPAKASTGSLVAKSITDFGLSLVDDANAAAAQTTLGLVIGTNVQAWSANLDEYSAVNPSANALLLLADADVPRIETANTWTGAQLISVNSASNALEIRQIGSGNAFLVEDSANPDSSPFVIDNAGNLIVGYTSAGTDHYVDGRVQLLGTSGSGVTLNQAVYSTSAGSAPFHIFSRSNTTTVGGHGVANAEDQIGHIVWTASDGATQIRAAQIVGYVDAATGINDMPGRLVMSTTADGASAPTEHLRIDSVGNIVKRSATGAIGYGTGAGGTVTQLTSKSTGVTLSKPCGQITMHNAALAGDTTVSFTLTNTVIAAGDILEMNHISGGTGGSYTFNAQCGAGSAVINVRNITTGSLSEAIVIAFAITRAVTA